MTAATIRSLQATQFLNVQENQESARDDKHDAIDKQKEQIGETFEHRMDSVEEMRDAREKQGLGTLIGTICCPLIGTLIGSGIGKLAGSGDRQDMMDANTDAGLSEIERSRAQDDFATAQEDFDAMGGQKSQLQKFAKELRAAERALTQESM